MSPLPQAHGELLTTPVAGGSEFFELADNDAAVLFLPFPDLGEEGLAAQIMAGLLLFLAELAFDDGLGGDTGMVGSREPEDLVSCLAGATGEDVLQGVVEDMAEGQNAGDIRWRNNNRVGRS